MAYVRPAGGAADRQFVTGYARPAALSADAQFDSEWLAAGFRPTTFGTALAVPTRPATGFALTAFGTPQVLPGYVPGFTAAYLGTPAGQQVWRAPTIGEIAKVPRAYYAFGQTLGAGGWASTTFGTPVATTSITLVPGRTASAVGWRPSELGVPALSGALTAGGFLTGARGTPVAGGGYAAQGFGPAILPGHALRLAQPVGGLPPGTAFGTPLAGFQRLLEAAGWRVGGLGTPGGSQPALAASLPPRTYLGTPSGASSRTYMAYGINRTGRVGTPRGAAVLGHRAAGAEHGVLGAPAAVQRHRALHLHPGTGFGLGLLVRDTTC